MRRKKSPRTREAVIDELNQLVEGRHPDCQTVVGRFIRDPEQQQASVLLHKAIEAEGRHRAGRLIGPPPGWLLP